MGSLIEPEESGESRRKITMSVSNSQILDVSSTIGAQPTAELDDVSERFFAEGQRQEASGWFVETPAPYRGSLDRIPRHHWPPLVALAVLVSVGAGVAWWTGWRPDWDPSALWRTIASV